MHSAWLTTWHFAIQSNSLRGSLLWFEDGGKWPKLFWRSGEIIGAVVYSEGWKHGELRSSRYPQVRISRNSRAFFISSSKFLVPFRPGLHEIQDGGPLEDGQNIEQCNRPISLKKPRNWPFSCGWPVFCTSNRRCPVFSQSRLRYYSRYSPGNPGLVRKFTACGCLHGLPEHWSNCLREYSNVFFSLQSDLFVLSRQKWEALLKIVHCEIISYSSNEHMDAYVLRWVHFISFITLQKPPSNVLNTFYSVCTHK